MYIHRLQIENLRCFENAELAFVLPPAPAQPPKLSNDPDEPAKPLRTPNVNLILADNGGGKTTVLRAIALSLLGPVLENSGLVLYRLVRRTQRQAPSSAGLVAFAQQHEQDEPGSQDDVSWEAPETLAPEVGPENRAISENMVSVSIQRRGDLEIFASQHGGDAMPGLYNETSPAFFVLGYGATRRTESSDSFDSGARSKSRIVRYARVSGLFEDHVTLVPLSSWLPRVEENAPARFEEICSTLNALLPDDTRIVSTRSREAASERVQEPGERYLFRFGDSEVPFPALSDGYRAYIGWVGDMLYHLSTACPPGMKLAECRGVVMVDEVDLHLHPSWQRTIVDTLSQTFPRLQFILTTHSPIVAGTLEAANIWVLESDDGGSVSPRRYHERIFGLSADQILTSSYFNLLTTRAPHAEKEISALAERTAAGDAGASLEALRRLTGRINGDPIPDAEIIVP
jgi:hypothetical protein